MSGISDDGLDALLARSLGDVADNGFSTRVIARANALHKRGLYLEVLLPVLGAGLVLAVLPLQRLGDALTHITPTLANSAPLGLAIAALILTFSFEQRLRE
jgi:hypothetical protein